MAGSLSGKRIAFLVADEGVEQVELTKPWRFAEKHGAEVSLLSPSGEKVRAMNHLDQGDLFDSNDSLASADIESFDGIVLPGGVANPDQLRMNSDAVQMVRRAVESGKPVAVICHGPWTLVQANVLDGRTVTSWPSLRTDIENAGGTWVDRAVVVCADGPGPIVSSRKPEDLPDFCDKLLATFAAAS